MTATGDFNYFDSIPREIKLGICKYVSSETQSLIRLGLTCSTFQNLTKEKAIVGDLPFSIFVINQLQKEIQTAKDSLDIARSAFYEGKGVDTQSFSSFVKAQQAFLRAERVCKNFENYRIKTLNNIYKNELN